MSTARTAWCLALFWGFSAINPASAEVSGQQRAQAAGRAILGAPAPRGNAQDHRRRQDRPRRSVRQASGIPEVLGDVVRALPAANAAFRTCL